MYPSLLISPETKLCRSAARTYISQNKLLGTPVAQLVSFMH